jgi:hypothetical protein
MSVWTIKPQDVRIDLQFVDEATGNTHPFWIRVKRKLTVGEQRRQMTAGWKGFTQRRGQEGAEVQIDWQAQSFARTEAYLTDWSLTEDDGKKIPLTRDGIESLDEKVYELIEGAINAHVDAMEQEKKVPSGEPSPSVTSD